MAMPVFRQKNKKVSSELEPRGFASGCWRYHTFGKIEHSFAWWTEIISPCYYPNYSRILFTLTIWMNFQVCTEENYVSKRTGSWECTVILAQMSVFPRVPINDVIISVVITIFVPLFKDTYGHQNRGIISIRCCQIAFWKQVSPCSKVLVK